MVLEIVIASGKGGVGKSLVTSSLLYILNERYNVIGVDADAPAPNLGIIFGVDKWDQEWDYIGGDVVTINQEKCIHCGMCADVCVYDAIYHDGINTVPHVRTYLCEGCRACVSICPVDAIGMIALRSGIIRTANTIYGFPLISAKLDVGRPNSGKLVAEERQKARNLAQRPGDVVFIDSAAGIGCAVIASMTGANIAILVAEPTPASLWDLKRIHAVAEHFGIETYIVVNKYDIDPGFRGIDHFAKTKGIRIIGQIPYDENVPKSLAIRIPMVKAFPHSPATVALYELVETMATLIEGRIKDG